MKSGMTLAIGGYGCCGVPETLIDALCERKDVKDLTVYSLTAGTDDYGVGKLIANN